MKRQRKQKQRLPEKPVSRYQRKQVGKADTALARALLRAGYRR